jgi:DNA polymerase III subunit gamma/tau
VESPLALYRRYRPETFAEVIGQDHVTEPLRAALAGNRVNHAYLFSGPRGCGKTTSARILARTLNCEKAPVADPCGACDSCQDLSRGGSGSIDVIEIDAASHGGVDDARDLREKAFFAPVRSRYKVYIIDEAHMVSAQGFNALLKLVEEPPPHLRFIFATTEPEKVLPTIRSRTHHYPFRLIPPRLLSSYLSQLCDKEGVTMEPAALPLVVRAGGGSARDTLSVLDQLMGGAGHDGITHALAAGLLGYTPDTLLDEVVDAFSAGDGAAVFGVVDKVIETGQDPRRFAEDLLRRLRDLVIVSAVPDAPATGLIDIAEDAAERLVAQAARFGPTELSRAADLVATGLTEMRGATAPRLLLELICARVLLPGADHSTEGLQARLDRLERRVAITGGEPGQPAQPAVAKPGARVQSPVTPDAPATAVARDDLGAAVDAVDGPGPAAEPAQPAPAPSEPATTTAAGSPLSLVDVRRLWPDIVEATKQRRRVTWIHLTQQAHVVQVDDETLTLGFGNTGARDSFDNGGSAEIVRQAAIDVVGHDWRVETIVDPGAQPASAPPPAPASAGPAASVTSEATAPVPTRTQGESQAEPGDSDGGARHDDVDVQSTGLDGAQLLQEALGAEVIEEIPHQ